MWILILFAHVGVMGSGNSNSLTTAEFSTEQSCKIALQKSEDMSSGSTKVIKGICVKKQWERDCLPRCKIMVLPKKAVEKMVSISTDCHDWRCRINIEPMPRLEGVQGQWGSLRKFHFKAQLGLAPQECWGIWSLNMKYLLLLFLVSCSEPKIVLYVDNKYAKGRDRVATFHQKMNGMEDCRYLGNLYFEKGGYFWGCVRE